MPDSTNKSGDPWTPYIPSERLPWDLARVVHLHRRAGFAGSWTALQRDLSEGPKASLTRVLQGRMHRNRAVPEFEAVAASLADSGVSTTIPERLKAWWVFRMLFTPDPLGERLTLFWHNHFATSNLKVENLAAMRRQNEIFRESARAPFGELLRRVVKDAALLDWLDAPANRREHPNENLAREMMELFTLGVGNYTELDVQQGGRALTGWSYKDDGFREFPEQHDDGEKTILNRTGHWNGDDFVAMLLGHPATSIRLAKRLCELFMGNEGGAVTSAHIENLAEGLRIHQLDIGWAVERILRSEAFFAASNLRTRVLGPPEFVIGTVRAFEQFDPPPSTLLLAEWIARMGQDLFYPPNVFGWRGGRSWIDSRSLVARMNFAASFVQGATCHPSAPGNILGLIERTTGGSDREAGIRFLSQLLLGSEPTPDTRREFESAAGTRARLDADAARRLAICVLASPEAQLG
ncbi:MAG: DUF1800 domain-containing protein [Planctomycetaceae bacterium]|nr:DUF1800 domain-containing protein [Planctomycetaceae bacterium]